MLSRRICLVLVGVALVGGLQAADGATVTVLKEGTDLTTGGALDAAYFSSVGPGNVAPQTVNDTYMTGNPAAAYVIFGNDATDAGTLLFKFNVSAIGPGAKIYRAQLRLRATNGNTSMSLARIITHDWLETTACLAGPNAPPSPTKTWGPASDSYFSAADYGTPVNFESAPSAAAWCVKDVTADVQAFIDNVQPNYGWYVNSGNHGIQMSEHATDGERPALFIAYDPNGPPNAVTDLAVTGTDWFKVDLRWTAPSDSPPGPVSRYEIRYSTAPIDDGNFASATQVTAPTPAAAGTIQTLTVDGLSASTTYYFAMKCYDATNWASGLSNVVSATTNPLDVAPPAAINTLAAPTVKPNYVTLTWTAVGDDGSVGVAAAYDLRYSTSPIVTEGDFAAATAVPGLPAPKVAGSAETFTVHGLTPSTNYWFAIKARDEVPNWSALGNVASFTTLAPDTSPPNADHQPEGHRRTDPRRLPDLDRPGRRRHGGHGGLRHPLLDQPHR
jgi:chitodextrinase